MINKIKSILSMLQSSVQFVQSVHICPMSISGKPSKVGYLWLSILSRLQNIS